MYLIAQNKNSITDINKEYGASIIQYPFNIYYKKNIIFNLRLCYFIRE